MRKARTLLDPCVNCGHSRKFHFLYNMTEDRCHYRNNGENFRTCTNGCKRYVEDESRGKR